MQAAVARRCPEREIVYVAGGRCVNFLEERTGLGHTAILLSPRSSRLWGGAGVQSPVRSAGRSVWPPPSAPPCSFWRAAEVGMASASACPVGGALAPPAPRCARCYSADGVSSLAAPRASSSCSLTKALQTALLYTSARTAAASARCRGAADEGEDRAGRGEWGREGGKGA